MIEILKQKYNYYWVRYADVNVGDTFVDDSGNVYVKIPVVFKYTIKNEDSMSVRKNVAEKIEYNCVSLKDGSLQKFSDNSKIYLIDCQMKWDYRKTGIEKDEVQSQATSK